MMRNASKADILRSARDRMVCTLLLAFLSAASLQAATYQISLGGFSGEGALERPGAIFYERTLGEIYVADIGHRRIAIYDSTGAYLADIPLHSLSSDRPDEVIEPCGVAADSNGRVYIATNQESVIRVHDARGNLLTTIEHPEAGPNGPMPRILFVDPAGNLHAIWSKGTTPWTIHDSSLSLVWSGGAYGAGDGEFAQPSGLWVDEDGRAILCDATAVPAVKLFHADHSFEFGFGAHDVAKEDLSFASGVVRLRNGAIYVADRLRQVIKQYDAEGGIVTMIGGWGSRPGELRYPAGLAANSRDRLFVAEGGGDRFQTYSIPGDSASGVSADTP